MVKTKKGGLLIKYAQQSEVLFNDFIKNTVKIEYIADGANGIIYKLTTLSSYDSGYTYIDPNYYGKPVREIALKICILSKKEIAGFKSEVNIQTDIFNKSIHFLQPLCPAILFSKVLTDRERKLLLKKIISINPELNNHKLPHLDAEFDISKDLLTNNKFQIGIIAMEYENGYNRLYDFINNKGLNVSRDMKIKYINYGLYILLQLALETGYSQADFHTANIMIHPNMDYFGINSGRPLILDFGYSRKIPEFIMRKIRELVNKKEYISALKWICSVKRSDNSNISIAPWSSYYGWVCRDWDLLKNKVNSESVGSEIISVGEDNIIIPKNIAYANNSKIDELFNLREKYKAQITVKFNKLNKETPINYPSLPLSEDIIKNHTYVGLLTGGKTKRNMKKRNNRTVRRI